MNELPKGWAPSPLSNVSNVVRGITFPASAKKLAHSTTNVCCLRTSNIQREVKWGDIYFVDRAFVKREEQFVQPGDVLMSMANSYELVGKVAIAKEVKYPTAFGAFLSAIRPTSAIDGKYLFHLLRTAHVQSELRQGSSQTTNIANISVGTLANIEIPLAPLSEQKRIADKLDTVLARVDACRDRLDRIPTLLKRFRQSILAAATSGRLTEDWRANQSSVPTPNAQFPCLQETLKEKESWLTCSASHNEVGRVRKRLDAFDASSATNAGLPDSWCWLALEDASLMVVDCHNKTAPYETEGIALVRTTNIRDGRFIWEDLRFVSPNTYQFWSKRCLPEPGDIVFTREAPMGEAAIIPTGTTICLGQRTMLIRPVRKVTNERYLLIALMDPMFRERAELIAVGTGVKHLRVGDVSELQLPLPPTDEQHEIVRRVEILFAFADRLEARLATARKQVGQLTPALLAKAFRGELVPQDPNDEPAAELLKRLATQREAAPKAKRGRKTKENTDSL